MVSDVDAQRAAVEALLRSIPAGTNGPCAACKWCRNADYSSARCVHPLALLKATSANPGKPEGVYATKMREGPLCGLRGLLWERAVFWKAPFWAQPTFGKCFHAFFLWGLIGALSLITLLAVTAPHG